MKPVNTTRPTMVLPVQPSRGATVVCTRGDNPNALPSSLRARVRLVSTDNSARPVKLSSYKVANELVA
jgi:hypothetical protein